MQAKAIERICPKTGLVKLTSKQISTFWSKVDKINDHGSCWNWRGTLESKGYGIMSVGVKRQAHRISYEMSIGFIPSGMFVCHHCDNRKCVRPDHLFLGTAKDNTQDMVNKGRAAKGERNGSSKLTEALVKEIRDRHKRFGESYLRISKSYDVGHETIRQVILGLRWAETPQGC